MPYPARKIPFDPRDYSTHQSLLRVGAYLSGATVTSRQTAIDYVVTAHAFSKAQTKTLTYDANLKKSGQNVRGDVRIGPSAFEQDQAWMAGIVFHELVHSPQYAYYAAKGVTQIDPNRSDPERLMIALDEYEAYWWSLKRSAELGLSETQRNEIQRRAQFALIDLDDSKVNALAKKEKFDAGRDELIQQHKAKITQPHAAMLRRNTSVCCA